MKLHIISLASLLLLSACSTTGPIAPVENRVGPGSTLPSTTNGNNGPGAGNPIGSNGISVSDASRTITPATGGSANSGNNGTANGGAAGANGTQVGTSIFFDYNDYTVKPESQDMLKQNFGTQKARDPSPIRIEGNADERGSREYNLALGQKRAEAVKQQLRLLGMSEAQLEAVSLGSEKPRETCHEERCWAANRRVDVMRLPR